MAVKYFKCYGNHLLNCIKSVKGLSVQELGIPWLSRTVRQIRVKIQIHFITSVNTRKEKKRIRIAEILRMNEFPGGLTCALM